MYEKSCASSNHIKSWKDIDFGTAEYEVKKLQMRIAKAVKENRVGKIKSLQWTLTHSFYAKAIAVKRVTENKGKRTPGVSSLLIQHTPYSHFREEDTNLNRSDESTFQRKMEKRDH